MKTIYLLTNLTPLMQINSRGFLLLLRIQEDNLFVGKFNTLNADLLKRRGLGPWQKGKKKIILIFVLIILQSGQCQKI